MMLIEQTAVPDGALPVQAMKDHLRLGSGFADDGMQDALVLGYLRAAVAAIEGRIGKALMQRRFLWRIAQWRDECGQALPVAPVSAVVSVALVDAGGVSVPVAADRFRLQVDAHRPRLMPRGAVLPSVPAGGGVEVVFDAGFAADWAGVPADLRQAVFLLAAQYHDYRHEGGMSGDAMPFGVMALIERWRNVRVLGAGR